MNGKIYVESKPGKGSQFIFTIKIPYIEKDAGLPDNKKEVSTASNKGEFTGKKLLLAEDIEINREILISLLEDSGLAIDIAVNGKEAFDKFKAAPNSYDFIFMDMQMPEMDGIEATQHIRSLEAGMLSDRRVPIIAMTANVFKEDIDNCLAVGMNDHIGKPIDINTVYEKLHKFM
jgi:CheY-like chemotaxis protein